MLKMVFPAAFSVYHEKLGTPLRLNAEEGICQQFLVCILDEWGTALRLNAEEGISQRSFVFTIEKLGTPLELNAEDGISAAFLFTSRIGAPPLD
jgi:hypothetical protein